MRTQESFLEEIKAVLHLEGWADLIRQIEEMTQKKRGGGNTQNVCQESTLGQG